MSYSADIVANIKTIEESEGEDGISNHTFLEEILSFPTIETATSDVEEGESTVKSMDDVKCSMELENCEDPLEENVTVTRKKHFNWEYNDEALNEVGDNENEEAPSDDEKKPKMSSRSKRARLSNEIKGQNGHVWSSSKTVASTLENTYLDDTLQALQPKGKGPAYSVNNPLEAWLLLVDDRMLAQVVKYTNEEIRKRKSRTAHQHSTDAVELRAWLGLNYLCGLFRNSSYNGPLEELWTLELGNAIFRATMSRKRFEYIAECLRFSKATATTSKRSQTSDLDDLREIWDKFMINCRSYYAPSAQCTIDEHIIITSDESSPFKCRLPTNPSECGLRLVALCDAKTLYMCKALLSSNSNPSEREVIELICDIKGTKRNVTLGERFTTVNLCKKLHQAKLSSVGALAATSREIPQELVNTTAGRKLYSDQLTLTAGLQSNENPTGFLLGSGTVNTTKLFSLTSPACQRFQQYSALYSTYFATPPVQYRWQLHFFHTMLDYAALNAWVLMRLSENCADDGKEFTQQRDFLRQLGLFLTQQQLKRRLEDGSNKLSLAQRLQICEILGERMDKFIPANVKQKASETSDAIAGGGSHSYVGSGGRLVCDGAIRKEHALVPDNITLMSRLLEKRARCRKCRGPNSPKIKIRCQQCLRPLCNRHLIWRCDDCTGVNAESMPSEPHDESIAAETVDESITEENSAI